MKKLFFLFAFVLCAQPSIAAANACVSKTFDQPLPGATQVETFVSDVPSSQFPAFWQTGVLDGYAYQIFANAEGTVRPIDTSHDWQVAITCDVSNKRCSVENEGTPPETVAATVGVISQCLLGAPSADASPETVQVPPAAAPCGSATLPEASNIVTMQRLLVMANQDPGPADGFLGPKTFAAMQPFAPGANWGTSIQDMIALLDAHLCESQN